MSDQDLAFRVQLLEEQVEDLRRLVEGLRFPQQTAVTTGSYTVVQPLSSRPQSESGSAVSRPLSSNGDYNALAEQIPAIPDYLVRTCTNLSGGTLGFRARAVRAWEAGWWAKFCLRGQLSKPRPTKPIDLANTCYIILRADGYSCPILVHRASDYRFILQDFKTQGISHGFPSLAEAKVYCCFCLHMESDPVRSIQEGAKEAYVFAWPIPEEGDPGDSLHAICFVVMRREQGLLLVVF